MKKIKNKILVGVTSSLLCLSSVSPALLAYETYADTVQTQQVVSEGYIDKEALVKDILVDIKSDLLPELELVQPKYQTRGAAGLMATLIAKYGIIYVKKQLPKIIYKHIAKYIGHKIGEAAFIRIFGNIVNWGTGAALEQGIAHALIAAGVDSNTANTVASVVVTVAWWFI